MGGEMSLTPEQQEFRRTRVMASEMGIIARLFPPTWARSTWADLYDIKTGAVEPWAGDAKTQRGELVAPVIAKTFTDKTGIPVVRDEISRAHPEISIIGATPDFLTPDGDPVEIKNVGTFAAKKWNGKPPDYVLVQLQVQMATLGKTKGYVAAWLEGSPNLVDVYPVEFNPAVWQHLVELTKAFWSHVEKKERPNG